MTVKGNHEVFDSGTQHIAGVYAKAFLAVAHEAGKPETLVAELDAFVDMVRDQLPDFQRVLESAFVSHEQKETVLNRALTGRAAAELLVFLKVISRHDRLDCLGAIRREVGRRYRAMLGRVDVVLGAAEPLGVGLRNEIILALRRLLGVEPVVTERTDPTLIGGLVITVGDTVYDGSLTTRLAQMRERMMDKCAEEIETHRQRFLTAT